MSRALPQATLGDLFEIVRSPVYPHRFPAEEFIHHSLPAFDERRGPVVQQGYEIESNKTLLSEPVVLLSKLNPRTSRVTVVDPSGSRLRHCCSTEFIAYRPKWADVCLRYYKYLFEDHAFRLRLQNSAIGTTNSHVRASPSETLGWAVLYPPLPDQNQIADVLVTVDKVIEQTEALIVKQQRIKTGLMQDLFARGIDQYGMRRSDQTHELKDSPFGRIPREWKLRELGSVSEAVTSGSRGWARYYSAEGPTFLRIGNLTRHHINLRLDDIIHVKPPLASEGTRTAARPGDLLISITADLGIIGVLPEGFGEAYVNQHIALVRLLPQDMDPRFIGWFLSSHGGQIQFERLNESGAKAGLNLPTVRKLLVPCPELREQKAIAQILDSVTESTQRLQSQLTKYRSLKTALMQDLLTGRKPVTPLLTPTEDTPDDRGTNP